jgi:hypothetical protein
MNYSTNQISTEPTTTNIPYAYGNLFSLFYFTTPISRTIFCENETLLNYLKATYANNSTTIPSSNITTFLQYYNSIKRNFNKNTNQ